MKKCLLLLVTLACGGFLSAGLPSDPVQIWMANYPIPVTIDPPGEVVIVSPLDWADNIDPDNVILIWEDPLTGGIPTHYEIFVCGAEVYEYIGCFQVYYPDNYLNLSALVDLEYSYLVQWEITAFNTGGQSDEVCSHFTTMAMSIPQIQIYQSEGFIYLGWQAVPGATGYFIYGSSDPCGISYSFLEATEFCDYCLVSDSMKFFRVIATDCWPFRQPDHFLKGAKE